MQLNASKCSRVGLSWKKPRWSPPRSHFVLPTSWEKSADGAAPDAPGAVADGDVRGVAPLTLPKVAALYRQKIGQVHDDLEQPGMYLADFGKLSSRLPEAGLSQES